MLDFGLYFTTYYEAAKDLRSISYYSLLPNIRPGVNILAFKPTMVGEKFPEIWG